MKRGYIMTLRLIDVKSDKWIIPRPNSEGDDLMFDFKHMPNEWIKNTHKQIIIDCIKINKPTIQTLHRYNYNFITFYKFIEEHQINIKTFDKLCYTDTQKYLFYLKSQDISNSTRSVSMSALKWLIYHGQNFEYDGFPTSEIFDGDEYKALGAEDVLKTKHIPDEVMQQIEKSLIDEGNLVIKSLLEILIDTGIRLGEVLNLKVGAITEDFTGKPVLEVNSPKNKTERYIPVSERVKRAINNMVTYSEIARNELNSQNIFIVKVIGKYTELSQVNARNYLKKYAIDHYISDSNHDIYNLTFHAFRHTLGTNMLNMGMSIFEISDYLGHESLHSTSGYAKLKDPTIQKEYKKLGFIGTLVEEINQVSMEVDDTIVDTKLESAALPDGACSKPINNQGNICAKFNMCIICPKFITTPAHLPVHEDHLKRLKEDKEKYMATEYIGTTSHLESIEYALKTIIKRLEEMKNGNK